jgi:hypothetical protein
MIVYINIATAAGANRRAMLDITIMAGAELLGVDVVDAPMPTSQTKPEKPIGQSHPPVARAVPPFLQ